MVGPVRGDRGRRPGPGRAGTAPDATAPRHPRARQSVYLYGTPGGYRWSCRAATAAGFTSARTSPRCWRARGYFVVGFDVKAYLESFTSGRRPCAADDEPGDYRVLAEFAAAAAGAGRFWWASPRAPGCRCWRPPTPLPRRGIAGVVGLGLPDLNELAGAGGTAVIYLTHGAAERADVQHRRACRPGGAGAAGGHSLHARRVRRRSPRSSACSGGAGSRSGCGSSAPPITASATTWRSSTAAA